MTATTTTSPPASPKAIRHRIAPLGRRRFSGKQKAVITVVNLLLAAAIWELAATYGDVPRLLLPKFSAVLAAVPRMHEAGILVGNLWISLKYYLIGMAISIVLAIPIGLVIGGFKLLDRILSPYVWAVYTTPRIILMPLILLWVGINNTARVLLIVVSAVPAILVVVMEGVKTVDTSLLRAARSFGADRWRLFTRVVFPSTIPFIGTAVRMGVSRGLIGLFIGELFTSQDGLGFIIADASKRFASARTYAIILIFVGFSVAMVAASQWLESKASAWRA
jgi:ABC-type nitrate/sulfonate/bicarbonate transport system permease component